MRKTTSIGRRTPGGPKPTSRELPLTAKPPLSLSLLVLSVSNCFTLAEHTAYPFRILGVPYERVGHTFIGIRSDLEKLTGDPKVTVPTIHVDGKYITGSSEIADYVSPTDPSLRRVILDLICWCFARAQLERTFGGNGKSLFASSEEGKRFAKLIELFGDMALWPELLPLIMGKVGV